MNLLDETNSRYHRQELITWWDQSRLLESRVLVVGAGALGNEVVKSLVLVGVGSVDIVDMDTIEHSNLARCVFFRDSHEGQHKASVLAEQAALLNPDVTVRGFTVPVQRLGVAALGAYDLVIGALDNREARAWVNQGVRKLGRYWIDGAIEGLRGLVRMFGPTGPCYACTLTEADWAQMSHRKSCALLAPEEILSGKTPTNATTASLVAAIEVQEAIKYLVGREDLLGLVGRCWVYTGDTLDAYSINYREDEWCGAHDTYLDARPTTAESPAALVAEHVGDIDALDFEEDIITLEPCATCGGTQSTRARSSLAEGAGRCPGCGESLVGTMATSFLPNDERLTLTFAELGLANQDIVTLRHADERTHYIVKGEDLGN